MLKKRVTTVSDSYKPLLEAIQKEIQSGQQAVERQKAQTYWNVGRLISRHLLENRDRAKYGEQIFQRLAESLDVNKRILHQAVKFYETYPNVNARSQLGWAHYRRLISVKDESKRRQLEARVVRERLTTRQLEQEIKKERTHQKVTSHRPQDTSPLAFTRGRPYLYQVKKMTPSGALALDCGFYFFHEIDASGASFIKEGALVTMSQKEDEAIIEEAQGGADSLFTFKAYVESIIDGDTLWARADLGFGNWTHQKLRLRDIDAPEIDTPAGQKAKRYVEQVLKNANVIVIKTYKPGKYGRYLTDIFYLPEISNAGLIAQKGKFLNQELVDKGLAIKV